MIEPLPWIGIEERVEKEEEAERTIRTETTGSTVEQNCEGFGHLTRNCRNRGIENIIEKERRLEYRERRTIKEGNKNNSNLNREWDLILLD